MSSPVDPRAPRTSPRSAESGNTDTSKESTAAPVERSPVVAAFYDQVARLRFGDAIDRPVEPGVLEEKLGKHRLQAMSASATPEAMKPRELYLGWSENQARLAAEAGISAESLGQRYDASLQQGAKLLSDVLHGRPPLSFGGEQLTTVDYLSKVVSHQPDLALATAFAKHPALGGKQVLERAIERAQLPESVLKLLGAQPITLPDGAAPVKYSEPKMPSFSAVNALSNKSPTQRLALSKQAVWNEFTTLTEAALKDASVNVDGPLLQQLAKQIDALVQDPAVSTTYKQAALDAMLSAVEAVNPNPSFGYTTPALALLTNQVVGGDLKRRAQILPADRLEAAQQICIDPTLSVEQRSEIASLALAQRPSEPDVGEFALALLVQDPDERAQVLDTLAQAYSQEALQGWIAQQGTAEPWLFLNAELMARAGASAPEVQASELPAELGAPGIRAVLSQTTPNINALFTAFAQEGAALMANLPGADGYKQQAVKANSELANLVFEGKSLDTLDGGRKMGIGASRRSKAKEALQRTDALWAVPLQLAEGMITGATARARIEEAVSAGKVGGFVALQQVIQRGKLSDLGPRALPEMRAHIEALLTKSGFVTPAAGSLSDTQILLALAHLEQSSSSLDSAAQARRAQDMVSAFCQADASNKQAPGQKSAALLPFAGFSEEQNLERLNRLPANTPRLPTLLKQLALPRTAFLQTLKRVAESKTKDPALCAQLLTEALAQKQQVESLLPLAEPLLRSSNAMTASLTLQLLADHQLSSKQAGELLAQVNTLPAEQQLQVMKSAAELAAQGKGFTQAQVLDTLLGGSLPNDTYLTLLRSWFVEPGELVSWLRPEDQTQVFDHLFATLKDRKGTGHPTPLLGILNAVDTSKQRLGKDAYHLSPDRLCEFLAQATLQPQQVPEFGEALLRGIAATGQKVEVALAPFFEKDFAAQTLTPAELLNARLRVLRHAGNLDKAPFEPWLKEIVASVEGLSNKDALISWHSMVELVERDDIPAELLEPMLNHLLRTSEGEKALWSLEFIRTHVESGQDGAFKLRVLEHVVRERMKEDGSPWRHVESAQRMMSEGLLDELRPQLRSLAQGAGDPVQLGNEITEKILNSGANAHLIADVALNTVRAEARLVRPSLDDTALVAEARGLISQVANAGEPSEVKEAAKKVPSRNVFGIEIARYQGPKTVPVLPRERKVGVPAFVHTLDIINRRAVIADRPLILFGPSGAAKTAAFEFFAKEAEAPELRLNGHPKATEGEIFGEWTMTKDGTPEFVPSPFLKFWTEGGFILIDEFNVYPEPIQKLLAEMMRSYGRGEETVELKIGGEAVTIKRSKHTRVVMAGNPSFRGTTPLTPDLNGACEIEHLDRIPAEELVQIVTETYPDIPREILRKACEFQFQADVLNDAKAFSVSYPFSIRNLFRVAERFQKHMYDGTDLNLLMARECRKVYVDGMLPADRAQAAQLFGATAGKDASLFFNVAMGATALPESELVFQEGPQTVTFGGATLAKGPRPIPPMNQLRMRINNQDVPVVWTQRLKEDVAAIFGCWENNEAVIFKGDNDNGSSIAIDVACALSGRETVGKTFTSNTDVGLLLGGPTLRTKDGIISTEFVPGSLTRTISGPGVFVARKFGDAKPAVQARLHPVFEEKRTFSLQNGQKVEIDPLAQFVSTDVDATSLSPAMSNRMTHYFRDKLSEADRAEVLKGIGEDPEWGVPSQITERMIRFESIYRRLVLDTGRSLSHETHRSELPATDFERLITWMAAVRDAFKGKTMDGRTVPVTNELIAETFAQAAVEQYSVAEGKDILRDIARALAEGNEARVKQLSGQA